MIATYVANRHFTRYKEPRLVLMPLETSAMKDYAVATAEATRRRTLARRLTMAGGISAEEAEEVVAPLVERERRRELFGFSYVQPELLEARHT